MTGKLFHMRLTALRAPRTLRITLFAESRRWMAPEVEGRWKLGHMTASRKAHRA